MGGDIIMKTSKGELAFLALVVAFLVFFADMVIHKVGYVINNTVTTVGDKL